MSGFIRRFATDFDTEEVDYGSGDDDGAEEDAKQQHHQHRYPTTSHKDIDPETTTTTKSPFAATTRTTTNTDDDDDAEESNNFAGDKRRKIETVSAKRIGSFLEDSSDWNSLNKAAYRNFILEKQERERERWNPRAHIATAAATATTTSTSTTTSSTASAANAVAVWAAVEQQKARIRAASASTRFVGHKRQHSSTLPTAQYSSTSQQIDKRRANKDSIARMLASRRRQCIRFAADRGCFVFKDRSTLSVDPNPTEGEVSLIGVRDILRRVCFANYRYEEARDSGTGQMESQRIATGLKAAHHGSARGRDVHEQLSVYIQKGEQAWKMQFGYGSSPYVTRIINFLRERGLKPVASEFQDYFNYIGIGSAIDILCEDTENDGLAIIELKIGGENYFEKANGPLLAPHSLTNYGNSPRNQALLQLLVYRAMITTNYPYVNVSRSYVLQVRTDAIVLYGLTPDFVNAQTELVAALTARREFDKRQQKASAGRGARGSRRGRPWQRGGKV